MVACCCVAVTFYKGVHTCGGCGVGDAQGCVVRAMRVRTCTVGQAARKVVVEGRRCNDVVCVVKTEAWGTWLKPYHVEVTPPTQPADMAYQIVRHNTKLSLTTGHPPPPPMPPHTASALRTSTAS